MERLKKISFLLLLATCAAAPLSAQQTGQHNLSVTLPAVVMMDIEPNATAINLQVGTPTEAGNSMPTATNSTKWLNYTVALAPSGSSKTVRAQVTSGTVPSGVSLTLQAGAASGSGAGTRGTSAGAVTLNGTSKSIVTGIGRAYTGTGSNNGHQLTYSLVVSNTALLNFNTSGTVTITFTISD